MRNLWTVDWSRLFVPSVPIPETIIRGSCIYLAVFAMLRVFRRQTGSLSPADLLVLLLIADASQNGMTGDYHSITDGILLIATIIGWEYTLDWLGYWSPQAQQVLERPPLILIKDGRIYAKNLTRELMTVDDLMAQLRRKGIESAESVKLCCLEGDGHVSVIPYQTNLMIQTAEELDRGAP